VRGRDEDGEGEGCEREGLAQPQSEAAEVAVALVDRLVERNRIREGKQMGREWGEFENWGDLDARFAPGKGGRREGMERASEHSSVAMLRITQNPEEITSVELRLERAGSYWLFGGIKWLSGALPDDILRSGCSSGCS
jgi:hypothetical protein